MMFQNDSAYMLVIEGCNKAARRDLDGQKEFQKALSKEAEGPAHEGAMRELMDYLKTALDLGMYYDVMRFTIKAMIYQDESFDYPLFYHYMEQDAETKELLPFAEDFSNAMREKNKNSDPDMADFLLKTQNIFSDDFGRFLYGNMKKCSLSYDMAITEEQVDLIAKSVRKKARPGMLLCLIDYVYAGRSKNMEIFWYAMRKYILPVLGTAKFTDEKSYEQVILRSLMNQYTYYIYNVVYLSYLAAKEEQSKEDELDPLVEYWDKEENKKSIDEAVMMFYDKNRKVLEEVLSGRTFDGVKAMIQELSKI